MSKPEEAVLNQSPPAAAAAGSAVTDARDYRRALGGFATGVCVVTARRDDGVGTGLTVNSFASVSLDPPLVSWCLVNHSSTRPVFEAADVFAVNVLAVEQRWLADHFAQSGGDKMRGIAIVDGIGGAPLFEGCVARFECRVRERLPGGDHVIFLGEVERYSRWRREPLLYCFGSYRRLAVDGDGG